MKEKFHDLPINEKIILYPIIEYDIEYIIEKK